MPCADAKGLLPGRGAPPGRGACGAPAAGAGRGAPGVSEDAAGVDASDTSGAAGAAGAGTEGAGAATSGAAGAAGAGVGAGAGAGAGRAGPGLAAGAAGRAGPGRPAAGRGEAAGAAGADAPADAEPSASRAARSLRATGGSIVEDGLLTNSPSSLSFARAILLSTPSSEAISCTRGFATILLSGGLPRTGQTVRCGRVSFRAVHFESIAVQPFRWRDSSKVCVSRGPDTRNARTNARRRRASSTHVCVS